MKPDSWEMACRATLDIAICLFIAAFFLLAYLAVAVGLDRHTDSQDRQNARWAQGVAE